MQIKGGGLQSCVPTEEGSRRPRLKREARLLGAERGRRSNGSTEQHCERAVHTP